MSENEDRLDELLLTVRRDSASGELCYVDEIDADDEGAEVHYVTEARPSGTWSDLGGFDEKYDEHVIERDEVWHLTGKNSPAGYRPNAAFAGADVIVTAVDMLHVTFKQINLPMAVDSDLACRLLKPESTELATFLACYERLGSIDEYENGDFDNYEVTDADRAALEKDKKIVVAAMMEQGPPDKATVAVMLAIGLVTQEQVDRLGSLKDILTELAGAMARNPLSPPKDQGIKDSLGIKDSVDEAIAAGLPESSDTVHDNTRGDETMKDETQGTIKKLKADDFKDIKVRREGHQIVLPEGMTTRVGIEWLTRIDKEDERTVKVFHEIAAYPIEGAYALWKALNEKFGFTSLQSTPGFFGDNPPVMVGLDISRTEHVQVPWGRIAIPGVSGFLETSARLKPDGSIRFVLSGEVKRRDEEEANQLVELVRDFATKRSIYKGKAIRVRFPENPEAFDFTYLPEFIDTSAVREDELVFPKEVSELVDVTLFSPIEKTALCRAIQIPLKRGILLEGPFGVGKTLTAYVTAKKCEENGWTFMYLDKTKDLKQAIMLARNYQPCVIFAEDIDRALDGEKRDEAMDEILNTIDGIDGKSSEIIVVLTTNNVEKINRAMLRPGRLDAVIPVRAPDAQAAIRLVQNYSRGLLRATPEEMVPVGEALKGLIPAVIREAVERAKLAAVVRLPKDATELDLRPEDLVRANSSMQTQLALMAQPIPDTRTPIEKAAATIAEAIVGDREVKPAKLNGESHLPVSGVEA